MIKTVNGVKVKLTTALEMGYSYCKVAVDGNNIGCALIKDILDSINYCHTPGGTIRTFIHRGYEYTVDKGIEIVILSNKDFMEHYIGLPSSKGLCESSEDANRNVDENYLSKLHYGSLLHNESLSEERGRQRRKDVVARMEKEIESAMMRSDENVKGKSINGRGSKDLFAQGRDASSSTEKNAGNTKHGIFTRLKNWLKGDVGYKR